MSTEHQHGADKAIHPKLAEAQAWGEANWGLLHRTFERFSEAAEWPLLEDLQHDFSVGGRDDIDVANLAHGMPNPLGFVEQGRLVLRIRGLSCVGSAAGLLDLWAAAVHLAAQRWIQNHKTAWLNREDVEGLTHGDQHQTDLVSIILLRERWPFGDGHGNPTDDDWRQKVIESARIARDSRDPATLLEKRGEVEFPPRSTTAPGLPLPPELDVQPNPPFASPSEFHRRPADPQQSQPIALKERLRSFIRHPIVIAVVAGLLWL
jgi:hypothetical protein